MSAFRVGHSWPAGNRGRSWVTYPLWFAGIGTGGSFIVWFFLLPWRLALWLAVEEVLLIVSLAIIAFRLIRRDRFRVVLLRLPNRLFAFDTV